MDRRLQGPSANSRYHTHGIPKDFPERLDCLRQLAGLSWREFAARLGVRPGRVRRWRQGVKPRGEALWAIVCLACRFPGGVEIIIERAVDYGTE